MIKAYLNTDTFTNHYNFYVIKNDENIRMECPSEHMDALIDMIAHYISKYNIECLTVDNDATKEAFFPAIKQQLQNTYNYNNDFSMEVKE